MIGSLPILAGLLVVALAGAAGLWRAGVSPSWTLSFVAVLALLAEFVLPAAVIDAVPGSGLVGTVLGGIGGLTLAVSTVLLIVAYWLLDARFGEGSAQSAEGVAEDVQERSQRYLMEWLTVSRLAVTGVVTVGAFALTQAGTLLGDLGSLAAMAPVAVSHGATIILGWLALGGNLPVLGPLVSGLTPPQWALITLGFLVVGVSVKNA